MFFDVGSIFHFVIEETRNYRQEFILLVYNRWQVCILDDASIVIHVT